MLICVFLFAPNYNKAFKNVAKVRKELTFRTIFNLLGPLLNPVRAKKTIIRCIFKQIFKSSCGNFTGARFYKILGG